MHAVQKILGEGTHPDDYVSPHGTTALLRAVETGQAKVVAALLEAGASPSVRNEMGEEPLSLALSKGHKAIVKLLPGGTHDLSSLNTKKVACITCGKVVGVGRPGMWCAGCKRCKNCGLDVVRRRLHDIDDDGEEYEGDELEFDLELDLGDDLGDDFSDDADNV